MVHINMHILKLCILLYKETHTEAQIHDIRKVADVIDIDCTCICITSTPISDIY